MLRCSANRVEASVACSRRGLLATLLGAVLLGSSAEALAKSKSAHAAKHADDGLAQITFAGFRPLPDGRSVVYVELSNQVPVRLERQKGVLIYELSGAKVVLKNNKNPLITSGFVSSLDSARLVEPKALAKRGNKKTATPSGNVQLVLRLRADVEPSHAFVQRTGGAVLEVTLPAPPRA